MAAAILLQSAATKVCEMGLSCSDPEDKRIDRREQQLNQREHQLDLREQQLNQREQQLGPLLKFEWSGEDPNRDPSHNDEKSERGSSPVRKKPRTTPQTAENVAAVLRVTPIKGDLVIICKKPYIFPS